MRIFEIIFLRKNVILLKKIGIFETFAVFLKNGEWTKRNQNHKGKIGEISMWRCAKLICWDLGGRDQVEFGFSTPLTPLS